MTNPAFAPRTLDPMTVGLHGTQLIEASAGTGKTYTIATLFVRLVVENGLSVDRILVVTFTEAAASELRDRIRRRLADALRLLEALESDAGDGNGDIDGDETLLAWLGGRASRRVSDRARLRAALQMFDEAAISTIHGFCHRVLHDSAFETGVSFETELIANQRPLLDQAVRDYWGSELYETDARFAGHILSQGLLPPRLFPLAAIKAAAPELPVIPRPRSADAEDTAAEEAQFGQVYADAREAWHAGREEIVAMLRAHPGMHKSHYKPADMERWFEAADGFFFAPTPSGRLTFAGLRWMQQSTLAAKANKKYRESGDYPQHAFFALCEQLNAAAAPLRRDLQRRTLAFKHGLAEYVTRELPLRKNEAGVQSFDDLLQGLDAALRRRKGGKALATSIRERYQAALIDEFQDTDPLQFRIFHTVYGGTTAPMLLIGDPKQAIYGFRGADVFAYLDAARDVPAARRHTLDTNWRSDPGLLQAIEHLFEGSRPFLLDGIDFVPVKARPGAQDMLHRNGEPVPPFEIAFQPRGPGVRTAKTTHMLGEWTREHLPQKVAHDIHAALHSGVMLGDRPLRAGDIAVLSRTNVQAQQVQAALRDLGIPGVVYGDASVYETREADEFERVLAAIAEPTARSLVRAALTTELLGVTGDQLEAMADDDEAWDYWVQLFRRWHELWTARSFIRMQRALMSDLSLGKRLLALADGERRMTNLRHLTELLHEAASRDHLGPAGLRRWLSEQRTSEQFSNEAVKLRLERDDEAVQLITIHRSKGLEYPVVYCPYLWGADELRRNEVENLKFHDPADDNVLKLDISDKPGGRKSHSRPPNVEQAQFETSAESLRLLYVALTRARHRCVVTWGAFDRFHYSALAFLLHGKRFGETLQGVADGLRKATDDELVSWLQERLHPTWALTQLGDATAEGASQPATLGDAASLSARTPRSSIDRLYRTTSFTGIVAAHGHVDLTPGQDRDQTLRDRTQQSPRARAPESPEESQVRLAEFPRGAHVGNFFHEVLEHLPFDADDTTVHARVASGLRAHGVGEAGLAEVASAAVRDVLTCPLNRAGVRLCDLSPASSLAELGFTMPVAAALTDATGVGAALDRSSLRRALLSDPSGLPEGYADHLLGLDFIPIRGFLRGFIDLVFMHEGKWYVVDYKTNDLGPHPSDYAREHLDRAMAHEHYVLQYHLYTVALCRHLKLRQPGFDYDRDFGGALYLFLRGMSPEYGCARGIYAERPPRERIEALDALLHASANRPSEAS